MVKDPTLIRPPAVSGRFYPADPELLRREVERYLGGPRSAPGAAAAAVMAPHAGYVYSGAVAGEVFAALQVPRRAVILGPNHTGLGRRIAVAWRGAFRIPGADVPIDEELAQLLLEAIPGAESDCEAHRYEHAIEVELPFLVARRPDVRIVPIVLGNLARDQAIELGVAIHRAAQRLGGDVLVVASSDMSHYLPEKEARELDRVALEPLLAGDARGLYDTVTGRDISMCGFIPATAMLSYCKQTASAAPQLVRYATSGDAFGDRARVVGYAGIVVRRQLAAAAAGP